MSLLVSSAATGVPRVSRCNDQHRRSVFPGAHKLAFPAAGVQQFGDGVIERHGRDRFEKLGVEPAFGFRRRPPVQRLRATIPAPDDSIHVADEYGVVREVEQVRLLPQGFFGPLALGDVRHRPDEEHALRIFTCGAARDDANVLD